MKWKIAFFTLLAIIIGGFLVVILLLTSSSDQQAIPEEQHIEDGLVPLFTVETDLERVNRYIESEFDEPFRLESQEEQLRLSNTYEVVGMNVDIQVQFIPEITENGNIRLIEDGFSVGALSLPASTVLRLVDEAADFPDWIYVNANEGVIDVRLTEIELDNDLVIQAESFQDGQITIRGNY
ncbi:hypothetical protein DH09_08820 [Bacillaceae bacterium JMAK1]|nr:hypothetical protein DH09_08820 [Bacillaceae bacterium JMAK1]